MDDVVRRDDLRVDVVFDGVVLGRQAEGVPAHRVEHVVALHPLFSGDEVERRVGARVADVQPLPGRIGELDQRVVFRLRVVAHRGKRLLLLPDPLPLLFDLREIVPFHSDASKNRSRQPTCRFSCKKSAPPGAEKTGPPANSPIRGAKRPVRMAKRGFRLRLSAETEARPLARDGP